MKLNIAYPANGTQKCIEMSTKEEQKLYGKKVGEQFDGTVVGAEYEGSIFQIMGGNDYQGVCMVPQKDTPKRIRLLLSKGDIGYRCRRKGVRRRKTVRGSVVSNETQVLNLILVKENKEIENLTDTFKDKSHFPKKLTKLWALFGLEKGASIKDHLKEILEGQKMQKLRIVRTITKKEIKKREEKKKLREEKKAKYLKEKSEYESKYGVLI
ncbi:hypothetical protein NUSPORA_01309 [Nucleospora cyclopteri]